MKTHCNVHELQCDEINSSLKRAMCIVRVLWHFKVLYMKSSGPYVTLSS